MLTNELQILISPISTLGAPRPRGLDKNLESQIKTDFTGSGYMTKELFTDWLRELDERVRSRRVALLMDNAPGHLNMEEIGLKNITFVRLPANTTSVSQPLDAGIICAYKVKYSRRMVREVSTHRLKYPEPKKRKPLPYAALWPSLVAAWDDVDVSTIRNCFSRVPTIP